MQAGKLAKMQASRHARKCKLGASKTLQAKRKTRCKCRQKSVKQENAGERTDNASRQAEKKCGRVHRTASVKVSKLEKLEIKINKVKLGGRGGLGEEEVRKEKRICMQRERKTEERGEEEGKLEGKTKRLEEEVNTRRD